MSQRSERWAECENTKEQMMEKGVDVNDLQRKKWIDGPGKMCFTGEDIKGGANCAAARLLLGFFLEGGQEHRFKF